MMHNVATSHQQNIHILKKVFKVAIVSNHNIVQSILLLPFILSMENICKIITMHWHERETGYCNVIFFLCEIFLHCIYTNYVSQALVTYFIMLYIIVHEIL